MTTPYRTRRKSSLSNIPFSLSSSLSSTTAVMHSLENHELSQYDNSQQHYENRTKKKYCFRCQRLLDEDNIKISENMDSSIVTSLFIEGKPRYRVSVSPPSTGSSAYSTPITSPNSSFSSSPSAFTNKRRRRSSLALTTSFQESLLTGRTSGFPSNPISFTAKLVISEFDPLTDRLIPNKDYARSTMKFDAIYYNWESTDHANKKESPYVGNIDLEKCFIEKEILNLDANRATTSKRSFPGHIIPESFIIQLLLINDQDNLSDCLVFKFDMLQEDLQDDEKTFLRKSAFILNKDEKQFISTMQINIGKVQGKYILFNNIKVIFYNKILPIMNKEDASSSPTTATTTIVKHSEIVKGGKSKLNIEHYKKCSTCNQLNEKLLHLKSVEFI